MRSPLSVVARFTSDPVNWMLLHFLPSRVAGRFSSASDHLDPIIASEEALKENDGRKARGVFRRRSFPLKDANGASSLQALDVGQERNCYDSREQRSGIWGMEPARSSRSMEGTNVPWESEPSRNDRNADGGSGVEWRQTMWDVAGKRHDRRGPIGRVFFLTLITCTISFELIEE